MNINTKYEVEGLLGFLYMSTSQMRKAGKLYTSAFGYTMTSVECCSRSQHSNIHVSKKTSRRKE